MAQQRQFRQSDTSPWGERYGSAVDGSINNTGNLSLSYPTSPTNGAAAGAFQIPIYDSTLTAGMPVVIHQTQGRNSGAIPNYEFNVIDSVNMDASNGLWQVQIYNDMSNLLNPGYLIQTTTLQTINNNYPTYGANYTARSICWIKPTTTGTHTFTITVDDGGKLWVANQLLINAWQDQGATGFSASITLNAGQYYPVIFDHYNNGGGYNAQVQWSGPDFGTEFLGATVSRMGQGIATLKYPLMMQYDMGAQIQKIPQYLNVTNQAAGTLTVPAWNGTVFGIWYPLIIDQFLNQGVMNFNGLGFAGGPANSFGTTVGARGEGNISPYQPYNSQATYVNLGSAAGGGGYSNNSPWNQGNGGGGGGNAYAGSQGIGTGGGNNSNGPGGYGGAAITAFTGICASLGGGGGAGGSASASGGSNGSGGQGAGLFRVIAAMIVNSGTIYLNGNSGSNGGGAFHYSAGGSGAGGFGEFSGQQVSNTGTIQALGGPRVYHNGTSAGDADGGPGGNGYIAVDYSSTESGWASTNPVAGVTFDPILAPNGGFLLLM